MRKGLMDLEITFRIKKKSLEVIDHLTELFGCEKEEVLDCLLFPFAVEILDLPCPPGLQYEDYMKYCQFTRDAMAYKKLYEKSM